MTAPSDTEIETLRERCQEYRQLLEVSYCLMMDPAKVSDVAIANFLTKLREHGINDPEKGWHKSDTGKGIC